MMEQLNWEQIILEVMRTVAAFTIVSVVGGVLLGIVLIRISKD